MTPLQKAAQALLNSWDSPRLFTDSEFEELRKALDAEITQSVEPYAVFQGLVDSGEHGAFNLDLLKMIPRGAYLYLHPPQPQATTVVPEGYVLVPVEPTEEALANGVRAVLKAELARPESTVVSLMRAENAALKDAAKLALDASKKFVNKVDSGQARSVETYSEMTQVIEALKAVL